mgnify:CR=1 FL=1
MIRRILQAARKHPVTFGLLVLGTLAGAIGGLYIPVDTHPALRALGGAIAGFYFALFPLGERLFD